MNSKKNLQDLSTDLIRTLADFLPAPALVNLRATCRKIETDTFPTFALRVFGRLTLAVSKGSVDRLTRVLADSPQLASAIYDLALVFNPAVVPHQRRTYEWGSEWRTRLANQRPVKEIPDGKIGQLLAQMPELVTLHLHGVTSSVLQRQLQPKKLGEAMRKAEGGPYTLNLRYTVLPSSELQALIKAFDDSVGELRITYVASSDGKWHSIFSAIQTLELERLEFNELRGAILARLSYGRDEILQVLEEDRRINRGVRGEKGGIESFWVRTESACMMGEKAVEAGLGVVCGYVGAHERSS